MLRDLGIFIMNGDKYNSLPADLQEILVKGFQEMLDAQTADEEAKWGIFYNKLEANGAKLIHVDEAGFAEWAALASGIHESQLAALESKCPNIRTIYDRVMELNGMK